MAEINETDLAKMASDLLTDRQVVALRKMRDEEEEIVYERGQCWVGNEQFGPRTFFGLIRCMVISQESGFDKSGYQMYTINATGRRALDILDKRPKRHAQRMNKPLLETKRTLRKLWER